MSRRRVMVFNFSTRSQRLLDPPNAHDWCTRALTIVWNLPDHMDARPFGPVIDSESMCKPFWTITRTVRIRNHFCAPLKALQHALSLEGLHKKDLLEV